VDNYDIFVAILAQASQALLARGVALYRSPLRPPCQTTFPPIEMLPSISDFLRCDTAAQVAKTLDLHGAAIIPSGLSKDYLSEFHTFLVGHAGRFSPRDDDGYRFSINSYELCDNSFYKSMTASSTLCESLDAIYGFSCFVPCSLPYKIGLCGGDVVRRRCKAFQGLHSDWASYETCSMKLGYAIAVSLACHDIPCSMGPIRLIPWSEMKRLPKHINDADSKGYLVDLREGEFLIRDVRAIHSGSPNVSDVDRFLPGCQVLSPQYLEYLKYMGASGCSNKQKSCCQKRRRR